MLKVVAFMRQVANGLQMGGNFGTAHVYRSSLNAIIAFVSVIGLSFLYELFLVDIDWPLAGRVGSP